jgi:hypothetical protein
VDLERWQELNERRDEIMIFPVLEKLFITYCGKLIALPEAPVVQEPCNGSYHSAFPALKVLKLENLESFGWDTTVAEHIMFPQLEELSIVKCPKLISLPEAPKLNVIGITDFFIFYFF